MADNYKVLDVYERLWKTDSDAHQIIAVVEHIGMGMQFQVRWGRYEFDTLTDTQVSAKIQDGCQWHADHVMNGTFVPDSNAARTTRFEAYIDDIYEV